MSKTKLDPDLVDISRYNKFWLELFGVLERWAMNICQLMLFGQCFMWVTNLYAICSFFPMTMPTMPSFACRCV